LSDKETGDIKEWTDWNKKEPEGTVDDQTSSKFTSDINDIFKLEWTTQEQALTAYYQKSRSDETGPFKPAEEYLASQKESQDKIIKLYDQYVNALEDADIAGLAGFFSALALSSFAVVF